MFAHTKFSFVRMKGVGVKRGEESIPRSGRVFEIPVRIVSMYTILPNIIQGLGEQLRVTQVDYASLEREFIGD